MSSNVYTLKIDIDDSKIRDIEKRLMGIVGGQGQGGLGSKMAGAAGGGSQQNAMMKNIGKLALIATGVAGILMLVRKLTSMLVDSSPMLSQMLKLVNFGIMLILRPIGDFFGFFLRPLIIFFIRSIVLPWYRLARPIMQKFGQWLGMGAASNLSSNVSGLSAILAGDWDKVARLTTEGNEKILQSLKDAGEAWSTWFSELELPLWGGILTEITDWIAEQGLLLPNFGGMIFASFATWLIFETGKLPTLAELTIRWDEWIADITKGFPEWGDVITTVKSITAGILGVVGAIRDFFIDLAGLFNIDISGWFGGNTTQTTPSVPTYTDNTGMEQPNDAHPWITETPETKMNDWNKSRH